MPANHPPVHCYFVTLYIGDSKDNSTPFRTEVALRVFDTNVNRCDIVSKAIAEYQGNWIDDLAMDHDTNMVIADIEPISAQDYLEAITPEWKNT